MHRRNLLLGILAVALVLWGCSPLPLPGHADDPRLRLDAAAPLEADKLYTVVLHLPLLPLSATDLSFAAAAARMVEDFEQLQPLARVELQLVPLSTYGESLDRQVALSRDPVVGLSLGKPPGTRRDDRLLPVTAFVEPEREEFWPVSLEALEHDGELWGWPAWLEPGFVVAAEACTSRSSTLDELCQLGTGWSPADFRSFLGSAEADVPLALAGPPIELFSSFVVAHGGDWLPFDSHGRYQWTREVVVQAAGELQSLAAEDLAGTAAQPDTGTLRAFFAGSSIAVTGLDPWLLFVARTRDNLPRLRLLPYPTGRTAPVTPVRVTSLQVFRGTDLQSPGHYRVANELARYAAVELSAWVGTTTFAIPASQPALERWARELGTSWSNSDQAGWCNIEQAVAWTLATGTVAYPSSPSQYRQLEAFYRQALAPALQLLLDDRLTPDEFATRLAEDR